MNQILKGSRFLLLFHIFSSRQEWLDRKRAIQQQAAKEQQDGSELPNAFAIRSKRKPAATHQTRRDLFAHTLMHSDWLVDIPGLHDDNNKNSRKLLSACYRVH
jgi:hypothetical protein